MTKKPKNAVIYLALLVVVLLVGYFLFSNKSNQTMPNGLQITDEVVGAGATVQAGDTVTVNYVGTLANGQQFDSSVIHGGPQTFSLGQVIQGWSEGMVGMKVGSKRRLVVPSELGYGSQTIQDGSGKVIIPPNSTLIFDVELLKVQ